MAKLFDMGLPSINGHIKNVFIEKELEESRTIRKFRIVRKEGNRNVSRKLLHYNLDVIISIGYRVKSKRGTQFRIWATQRLRDYLVKGYTVNKRRLAEKGKEITFLRSGIKIMGRAIEEKANEEGFEYLKQFAKGLTLLDDYDLETLDGKGLTEKKAVYPQMKEYRALIDQMKQEFQSQVFGLEKDQGFESAIAQISKGFEEMDFYPSLKEKAATLLYLIIKNHAFTDGNKRIAAACFLMFLQRNHLLTNTIRDPIISNEALALNFVHRLK